MVGARWRVGALGAVVVVVICGGKGGLEMVAGARVVVRGGGGGQGGIGLWRVCACVCGLFSRWFYRVWSLVLWLGLVRCVMCPFSGLFVVVILFVLFALGV